MCRACEISFRRSTTVARCQGDSDHGFDEFGATDTGASPAAVHTLAIKAVRLDQTGIPVADYLTGLPPWQLLEQTLHEAIAKSNARLDRRSAKSLPQEEDPS